MQAKWVREIHELLRSEDLTQWYRRYREAREAIEATRMRREDLLAQVNMVRFKAESTQQIADDKLFAAGAYEDSAACAHAQFCKIENDSFEVLSAFEIQRQRATDTWEELDRTEQLIEDERQRASELRARADASRKLGSPEALGDAERLEARLKEIELRLEEYDVLATEVRDRKRREEQHRDELWIDVEQAWNSAFRTNMARTEYLYQARRARKEAEQHFLRAAAERRRVGQLEVEAERTEQGIAGLEEQLEAVMEEARQRFDCELVKEFLYWANKDDVRTAWCVPLVDDRDHLNIQISAQRVYKLERARGLEFLEPVTQESDRAGHDDARLDAFFFTRPKPPGIGSTA